MSDTSMRQLLRQLEKEKTEVEWQLKECEWRLDQEAAVSESNAGTITTSNCLILMSRVDTRLKRKRSPC